MWWMMPTGDDVKINPVNGMRIPLDFYFHDNDGSGWEGNLAWSPNNTDQAGKDPMEWAYTWIGDTTHVATAVEKSEKTLAVNSYSLAQNYPNPFNPSTIITYQMLRSGHVSIKVYNALGQEVATLVDEEKPAGSYQVEFNTVNLSSGVYFYKMRSGEFTDSKKLNLMK